MALCPVDVFNHMLQSGHKREKNHQAASPNSFLLCFYRPQITSMPVSWMGTRGATPTLQLRVRSRWLKPSSRFVSSHDASRNTQLGFTTSWLISCSSGPLQKTFVDFWRMVWEQMVLIIVMTTRWGSFTTDVCSQLHDGDEREVFVYRTGGPLCDIIKC